ncbi:DNA-binding transcriptional regulator, AcrR family [Saccharopolyspora antimicrobica]|uniref:DNA-binding transcriptional regulator, AcrR family n=1 Tax=Saccharopolyspora antimicrobica TaxID=455193 RepID=A0A1I4R884_9PSEU|nr:TetR/AcrR family transcriptional regulator [Saccharopolyspora antimicrobica]RKT88134.1 TetR family transcriptional regulator [Saccharopolyspora antimicrobica]SFM48150.1 DNA-binding transcriptional regulator, AcrR family [Saccharopolyspora antimicrobica]
MSTRRTGLREQKKQATKQALREAALRLALERGPDNVRVDDIAEAAGVSPRTYNNYFSSREQAIVAAITAERHTRVAAAVTARPDDVGLAEAVTDSIVQQYTGTDTAHDAMALITTSPALREAFLHAATAIEEPLATAIAHRLGDTDPATAGVLAAGIAAAVRTTLRRWLQPAPTTGGLVIPTGSLPDLLRAALEVLAPALEAAEEQHRRHR